MNPTTAAMQLRREFPAQTFCVEQRCTMIHCDKDPMRENRIFMAPGLGKSTLVSASSLETAMSITRHMLMPLEVVELEEM